VTEAADWLRGAGAPVLVLLALLPLVVAWAWLRDAITAAVFAALVVFWLLLSGHYTPFLTGAGVGCAVAVTWFARRMEVVDREGVPVDFWRAAFQYWPWLMLEIVKSGLAVSRIILDPRLPISPTQVRFRPSQRTNTGLVVHANSITLTPGTITVEAGSGEFLVHGLTRAGAEGCIDSDMDRRVRALERRR
jgi:multicomponent Na+:H+ antiporter subunit E